MFIVSFFVIHLDKGNIEWYNGNGKRSLACIEQDKSDVNILKKLWQVRNRIGGYKMTEAINIRGLKQNNLKNISLDIPKNKIVVFTGV